MEADVKERRSGTYLLTGGVGSGKTTFLRRYAAIVAPAFVSEFCVWAHVDYLPLGDVDANDTEGQLRNYTYEQIRETLRTSYPDVWPRDGEKLREILRSRIDEARLTVLHGLAVGSNEWNERVNAITHAVYCDTPQFVEALLAHAAKLGYRVVVILDNTDQLGERFQEAVFLLSQRLADRCRALAIVALREEKFFAAFRRGLFDAYGDRRFHIGSPNLEKVIQARLKYALRKYLEASRLAGTAKEEQRDVTNLLRIFIASTTEQNHNIVRYLSCVSNGDMRYALGVFRDFVSSGNTDVSKILRIHGEFGAYTVPFHEFAKSAILGSQKYFRSAKSQTVNMFLKSSSRSASHLTGMRILARLSAAVYAGSSHGQGFVETRILLGEFRQFHGRADDFLVRGEELLRAGLIESEPPRSSRVEDTEALALAASGAYYWRYLIRAFAYLDLMLVDTAIASKDLAQELAAMVQAADLTTRFERVRKFLAFLKDDEAREISAASMAEGIWSTPLVPDIISQVEDEILVIRRKTGAIDLRGH